MNKEADRAYCAGLYEGEGTITTQIQEAGFRYGVNRSKTRQITLSIAMTDLFPLDLFDDIMGRGKIYGPYNYGGNRKNVYIYRVATFENVQYVVCQIWGWLSGRRKDQIALAFTKYKNYNKVDMVIEGEDK